MKITKTYIRFDIAALRAIFILLFFIPLLSCGPDTEIRNLGIFSPSRTDSIAGQDGCTPIPFDRNTIMWTFGDTILGSWKNNISVDTTFEESATMKGMLSNSLAFSAIPDDGDISRIKLHFYKQSGKVAQFIKYQGSENPFKLRIWPLDGVRINDTVYVYYVSISIDQKTGGMPIRVSGMGLATWHVPENWNMEDGVNFKRTDGFLPGDVPTFGDSVIVKEGYLYLAGHKKFSDGSLAACFSRVRAKDISTPSLYQFLGNDGSWTPRMAQCGRFFNDVAGELSLSYNSFINKYIIIYSSIDGSIKTVVFNDFKELLKKAGRKIYLPSKLPEIKTRPLLFYYSGKEIFSTDRALYAIYINPAIYQPILLKIPYEWLR